jgi:hypothetical protein
MTTIAWDRLTFPWSGRDPEKKTHPCMLPYAELPESQKKKDDLFLTTVRAMAKAIEK